MRIVFVSHTSAFGPLRVGSHHLAGELAAQGHDVVHLAAPLTPFHLLAWRDPSVRARLRRASSPTPAGFTELTPRLPVSLRALERRPELGARLWGLARPRLRPALERLGAWPVDLLVIDYPYAAGVVTLLRPAASVYRATDVYPVLRGRPRLAEVERAIAAQVDHLVATSDEVARHLRTLAGPDRPVTVIPNAAPAPPAEVTDRAREVMAGVEGPVAVYAGVVDERFDRDLLARLLDAFPSVTFLLVGPPARPPVVERANLRAVGALPHEDLMSLLTLADVGLLPTNDHPANAGRSPIKVFEYRAAGLPVVARRTAELERLALGGVALHDDHDGAVAALGRALTDPRPPAADPADGPGDDQSWADRARRLLAVAGRA